jgi:phytol kinase
MTGILITILIFAVILLVEEWAYKKKVLRDEYQRKFVHMTYGTFMAFWPWLMTWHQIQLFAAVGVAAALIYKRAKVFSGLDNIRSNGYGHFTHPLSVLIAATMTSNDVFFCISILIMAIADGMAAIIGQRYGKRWQYKVLGHTKTVIGSMAFWLVSLFILGIGLLFANDQFNFENYVGLLIFAPPLLTAIENLGILGLDNLFIPPAVILMLSAGSL